MAWALGPLASLYLLSPLNSHPMVARSLGPSGSVAVEVKVTTSLGFGAPGANVNPATGSVFTRNATWDSAVTPLASVTRSVTVRGPAAGNGVRRNESTIGVAKPPPSPLSQAKGCQS